MAVNTHWSVTGLSPIIGTDLVCAIGWQYEIRDESAAHTKGGTWSIPVGDMDGDGNITFPEDYIPYTELTEAQLLDWLFSSFEPGFKSAVETATAEEFDLLKATGSPVLVPPTTPSGLPWKPAADEVYVADDVDPLTGETIEPPLQLGA